MTLWHASYDLRLTASSLTAAAVAKNLRLEVEAGREGASLGLGLSYRGTWDTSG
jgi:hypothetical protein